MPENLAEMEDLEAFRLRARAWLAESMPLLDGRTNHQIMADDEECVQARALQRILFDGGFAGLCFPREYGGQGLSREHQSIFNQESSPYEMPVVFNVPTFAIMAATLLDFGTEEQKARFMPGIISGETILAVAMTEPSTGSDLAGMKTRAVKKGDHWLLNGAKTYISNGILSDLVVVAARTDPDRPHGISLFLVERGMAGFERGRKLEKMGLKSQDTAELFFNDVHVPVANLLGEAGQGFKYLAQMLAQERLVAAIGFIATAQTAFDLTLTYVKERRAFGKPIGAFQNTRFKMAKMRAELDMAQTWVDQCVLLLNQGELAAEDASATKLLTSELEARVMDTCVQFHGGAGYMEEYRISRMYTDARISRIFAGTSEIMLEIIGRGLGLDERKMN